MITNDIRSNKKSMKVLHANDNIEKGDVSCASHKRRHASQYSSVSFLHSGNEDTLFFSFTSRFFQVVLSIFFTVHLLAPEHAYIRNSFGSQLKHKSARKRM